MMNKQATVLEGTVEGEDDLKKGGCTKQGFRHGVRTFVCSVSSTDELKRADKYLAINICD